LLVNELSVVRIPIVSRVGRIWVFVAVCVVLVGVGFGAGWVVRSPQSGAVTAVRAAVVVYATAEMRTVSVGLRAQGVVSDSEKLTVLGTGVTMGSGVDASKPGVEGSKPGGGQEPGGEKGPGGGAGVSGGGRAVVTRVGLGVGDAAVNGELLATVSDRPFFVLGMRIPPFRDLRRGDQGSDVKSLQVALGVSETGVVDSATLRAVQKLYARYGLVPPGGVGAGMYIAAGEILPVSVTPPPVVESVAGVGDVLGAGRPLAILRVGVPTIRFRATVASLSTVKQGALVKISGLKGRVVEGSVTSVSGFRGADSQQASLQPGYEVVVSFTEPPAADEFPTGQSVTVTDAATPPPSLAVPQVAIKQDASGPYVLKAPKDDSGHPGRVSVTVLAQSDGWVAIAAEGLVAGDRVQVQP